MVVEVTNDVLGALGLLLATFVVAGLVRRAAWRPGPAAGDPALTDVLAGTQPRGCRHAAVAVVGTAGVRSASVHADASTRFEIGSVTKALTGLLLAEQIAAGRCRLEDRLAELDDRFAGTAVGDVTLAALCTHRSGLPRLPRSWRTAMRGVGSALLLTDPYRGQDETAVIRAARGQRLGRPGYSNLGAAVLGIALARRCGLPFAQLLQRDGLEPLGMHDTAVARRPEPLAGRGRTRMGRRSAAWTGGGYAAAGGVVSTTADLTRLLSALVLGTAPGDVALHALADAPGAAGRIGMFWRVAGPDRPRVWHNGCTGGYAAFLAVEAGRGVVAMIDVADATGARRLAEAALRASS